MITFSKQSVEVPASVTALFSIGPWNFPSVKIHPLYPPTKNHLPPFILQSTMQSALGSAQYEIPRESPTSGPPLQKSGFLFGHRLSPSPPLNCTRPLPQGKGLAAPRRGVGSSAQRQRCTSEISLAEVKFVYLGYPINNFVTNENKGYKMTLDFHAKVKQLEAALNRLHVARLAHKTANKIYNDSKCWHHSASVEAQHRQLKSYERLEAATAEVKSAEAEIRQIKLARITDD